MLCAVHDARRSLPGLIEVEDDISGLEARSVVARAIDTLHQVGQVPADSNGSDLTPLHCAND